MWARIWGCKQRDGSEKMRKRLCDLYGRYRDVIVYLIFGVLTTLVNYIVFFPCSFSGLSAAVSNSIAWVVSVLFAYLTNKPFVFRSSDWSMTTVLPEAAKFFGCRIGSWAVESGILLVTVDLLHWSSVFWKIVTSVLVVVMNYVASKLLVFRKKK